MLAGAATGGEGGQAAEPGALPAPEDIAQQASSLFLLLCEPQGPPHQHFCYSVSHFRAWESEAVQEAHGCFGGTVAASPVSIRTSPRKKALSLLVPNNVYGMGMSNLCWARSEAQG